MTIDEIPEKDKKIFSDAMQGVKPLKKNKKLTTPALRYGKEASNTPHTFEKKKSSIPPFEKGKNSVPPFEKGKNSVPPFEKGGLGGISHPTQITPQTIDAYLSDYYKTIVNPDSVLSYRHPDLARTQWQNLKSGHIPWTIRLDLHRLTALKAREAIVDCLVRALSSNARCILLIHGKGGIRGEAPVLKNLVNHWLRQIPYILAFHSAIPQHGGQGAIYVLLKKIS